MKLNERSVAHYATCDSPPDKTGFLFKKGDRNTAAYHRRWCVLKGNMLFYFEDRENRDPIGVIVLEGCTVELCESAAEEFAFAIKFDCARARVYKMAAESQVAMESWVKALSRASFDYMRLVVRELERQLEEVTAVVRSPQERGKASRRQQQQGSVAARSKAPGSTGTPSTSSTSSAEEVAPPSGSVRENGVAWSKPVGLANGGSGGGEGLVSGVSWEVEGHGNGEGGRAPPVPPRRKVTGSLESPVSPETGCFSKLHEWYGLEVAELRLEWLQSQ